MQLKKITTIVLLFVATALVSLTYFTNIITHPKPKEITYNKGDNYDKLWKRVDSCEGKGLTESALTLINVIYEKAKKENNASQFVKAVIQQMKFESYKEEFSLEKSIIKLQTEVTNSNYPIKPVLQSVLADAFWNYYQDNRWRFINRTETVNFDNNDIETWDLKTITYAATSNFLGSLKNTDSLKRTKIDLYEPILIKGVEECRKWRPTLYDFLAHRALNYFTNSQNDLTKAANQFTYNDAEFLKPYTDFINIKLIKSDDSLDTKYHAVKTMQELTMFHLKDENPEALIDIELFRLDFIYNSSQNPNKDTLYINALRALKSKFNDNVRSTEIDYRMANWYINKSSQYKPLLSEDYKWYKKTAKEICENSIKKFPKSYGAQLNQNNISSLLNKQLNFTIEEVQEPNKPFRALITYQNISKVYIKIVQTTHQEFKKITHNKYGKELYEKINALKVIKSFEQKLIDDNDLNTHSIEVKCPELESGNYVMLVSFNPDFNYNNNITSHQFFAVSNISSIERKNTDGDYDIYTLNRQTGDVLPNTTLQIWHEKYNYKTREYDVNKGPSYKTNNKGYINIPQNVILERSFYIEYINGNDTYYNNNSFYTYKNYKDERTRIHTHYFTDRAIYRPGQTVYFKGIVLESVNNKNHKIKTNFPVTVSFYDVNYQIVNSLKLVTNEFGTINGSFITPSNGLNGQMTITDGHGNAYVSVEEYKRPKFEADFYPIKGQFKLNENVTVSGFAKAYAGNSIDGAKIKYRVVRKTNYPYWYRWYYPNNSTNTSTEITSGELTTNDTGAFVINFKALPDESVSKKSNAYYRYEISADVTDINGETHSTQTSVSVGYQSLLLSIQAKDIIDIQSDAEVNITTNNLNGQAEPTKGSFAIYKLKEPTKAFRKRLWAQPDRQDLSKEEYYKNFPFDLYEDEDNQYKWEKESKILEKDFDTQKTTKYDLNSEFKPLRTGTYLIEATCKDKSGEEIKSVFYTTLYNNQNTDVPIYKNDFFYLTKLFAEPGETIQFIQASSASKNNYLYEIEHQGKIISSQFNAFTTKPVEVKIEEEHRGNLAIKTVFIKQNRFYNHTQIITVPYTNKELDISFETFRNKLQPGQAEEWKLILKSKNGDKVAAELLASMYDASLDAFKNHNWYLNIYPSYYSQLNWGTNAQRVKYAQGITTIKQVYNNVPARYYDNLNYFGLHFNRGRMYNIRGGRSDASYLYENEGISLSETTTVSKKSSSKDEVANAAPLMDADAKSGAVVEREESQNKNNNGDDYSEKKDGKSNDNQNDLSAIKARSNFNETAFFFPNLQTNEKGEVIIKFTMPESLTKWKLQGLAHTKDLQIGSFEKEIITQKELMIQPNTPRFFRENDEMTFIAKISNLSESDLTGVAELKFFNALTEQEVTKEILASNSKNNQQSVSIKKGLSASVEWNLKIPENYFALKYKIVAKAGNFTDGEEMIIPVLTNRMLVTESLPLPVRSNQTKEFNFTKFTNQNNNSTTLKNHSYTLEFTANPAWYAIQALPYLMEYPYECAEQTFARYYANSLATYVVNSKPKIKAVFDAWKNLGEEAFYSNLQKNQELKSVLLEETPWVLQAKSEQENKKRVGLLFDLNKMSNEQEQALKKLLKKQSSNGGFVWFDGGPDDWYITQHIITGFSHLEKLGVVNVRDNSELWNMITRAVKYCDARMNETFNQTKKYYPKYKSENHLGYMAIQYLYMRSNFKDINLSSNHTEHFDYYKKQEQSYWLQNSRYMQAMMALSLHRYSDTKTPKDILKSLKENSLNSEEMGMYWKENYGYYWYEAPIEMQALMIEAFDEINNDIKSVDDLKTWLIKSKQTQHWGTTRATTDAVYALLLKGTDWLSTEANVEITVGTIKLNPKTDKSLNAEPGTGYFKKTWTSNDIEPKSMGKITVQKKDVGVSYGAVYWQYFEQLVKITPHETPLKLKKQLFLQKQTKNGIVIEPINEKTNLNLGDKITVRIELKVDRDMDYVHMKDMRASGLEPVNVISRYKYQDGLGYYESTRDAATHFFISRLNKGTYVFEYPLIVNHYGNFSNGITTIQCMYAPEFTSHSEGIRLLIKK